MTDLRTDYHERVGLWFGLWVGPRVEDRIRPLIKIYKNANNKYKSEVSCWRDNSVVSGMELFYCASVFLVGVSVLVLQTNSQGKSNKNTVFSSKVEYIENFSYLIGPLCPK